MDLPTVVYPLTLTALLNHVLTSQSGGVYTTLVICSSRDTFLEDIAQSLQLQNRQEGHSLQQLVTPNLQNLFTARHVRLAFCASVQTLLAYLTAFGATDRIHSAQRDSSTERLKEQIVLVNPLQLHAPTLSFSAQGLSRTFAAVVETATRVKAELLVVECQETESETEAVESEDSVMANGEESPNETQDLWEQEVSILNVSAKKFGSGSADRAWAGRTMKVKRIAGRWFRFRHLGT